MQLVKLNNEFKYIPCRQIFLTQQELLSHLQSFHANEMGYALSFSGRFQKVFYHTFTVAMTSNIQMVSMTNNYDTNFIVGGPIQPQLESQPLQLQPQQQQQS